MWWKTQLKIQKIDNNLIGLHLHDFDGLGQDHLPLGTGIMESNLFKIIEKKN